MGKPLSIDSKGLDGDRCGFLALEARCLSMSFKKRDGRCGAAKKTKGLYENKPGQECDLGCDKTHIKISDPSWTCIGRLPASLRKGCPR